MASPLDGTYKNGTYKKPPLKIQRGLFVNRTLPLLMLQLVSPTHLTTDGWEKSWGTPPASWTLG